MKVCDSKIPMTFPYVTSTIAPKAHAIFTIPNETERVCEIEEKEIIQTTTQGEANEFMY